ncbi:hypothetical protein HDU96_006457 [Phlyctochytrium bullatum]|nr:hypothetical protein HDU96_006457 [Phlyctochytrium bullatum]
MRKSNATLAPSSVVHAPWGDNVDPNVRDAFMRVNNLFDTPHVAAAETAATGSDSGLHGFQAPPVNGVVLQTTGPGGSQRHPPAAIATPRLYESSSHTTPNHTIPSPQRGSAIFGIQEPMSILTHPSGHAEVPAPLLGQPSLPQWLAQIPVMPSGAPGVPQGSASVLPTTPSPPLVGQYQAPANVPVYGQVGVGSPRGFSAINIMGSQAAQQAMSHIHAPLYTSPHVGNGPTPSPTPFAHQGTPQVPPPLMGFATPSPTPFIPTPFIPNQQPGNYQQQQYPRFNYSINIFGP